MSIFQLLGTWLKIFEDCFLPPFQNRPSSSVLGLCDDTLTNILLRVAPGDLARFKCVNKQCRRLISDPNFIQRYRSQLPDLPYALAGLFCYNQENGQVGFDSFDRGNEKEKKNKTRGFQCIDKSLGFLPHRVRILGSQDGLLLCITTNINPSRYYVSNPLTKQFTLLPESQGSYDSYDSKVVGFFLDRKSGHYQVIRIPVAALGGKIGVLEIFSSETGKWKLLKLRIQFPYRVVSRAWPAVQWNGSLHWLNETCGFSILAYDVTGEKFSLMKLPTMDPHGPRCNLVHFGVLGVSAESLCLAFSNPFLLFVWVRRGNEWVVARDISLWATVNQNLEVIRRLGNNKSQFKYPSWPAGHHLLFTPVCFDEFNPDVVFLRLPGWIVSYSFSGGKIIASQYQLEERKSEVAVFPYVVPQLPFAVEFRSRE